MALEMNRAILHSVSSQELGLSNVELDIDSETCHEFIQKHVRRLLSNAGAREATFTAESQVYALVRDYQQGERTFLDFSAEVCRRLAGIVQRGKEIPPADVLIADVADKKNRYLAVLKLNYDECFTRQVEEDAGGRAHHLIKNRQVLPVAGSKVQEACLIPYDPMVLRIMEKPYEVDGEEQFYFSRLFLECETEISKKETAEILSGIAEEINTKYYDDHPERAARLKCAFMDEAEDTPKEDDLSLDNVAGRAFLDNEPAKTEFLQMAKDQGLTYAVKMDKSFVQRQFKTQKFQADNGIELKFPATLFQDSDTIEFTTNSDGTVSILLKNLRQKI